MARAIKTKKGKSQEIIPAWPFNWSDLDRTFDNFRRDFERALTSFPSVSMPQLPKISATSCDVIDEGDKLRIRMDMPGVKKGEIDLNITDNSVEVSAEHKEEEEEKKKNFLRKERSEVSYYRTLPLPEKVVSARAKAKLTDGILNIILPKTVPTKQPKKKSIRVQ